METLGDLIALIRAIVTEQMGLTKSVEGVVVPGSYHPDYNTVSVYIGNTLAINDAVQNNLEMPLVLEQVPLAAPHIGFQHAPIGNECVFLVRQEGGWAAHFQHYNDDIQAPQKDIKPGETWLHLRSNDPEVVKNTFVKLQNDAVRLSHMEKIVALAGTTNLGDEDLDHDENNGVARKKDLIDLENRMRTAIQTAIQQGFAQVARGTGIPAPQIAKTNPNSSSNVFAK